ncbi:MAG: 4Fe-4S binding protein [Armatimonadetes bacterium]|nr:4Fe-4S binding protein [Armatimonadota bacterium]
MEQGEKALMTGNEAVARGAIAAGLGFAAAYPGTPSTEILEHIARLSEIPAEWSPNEKIAYEAAMGAAIAGAASLVAMKHVGLNVASDPFMTSAYTGVNGGLLVVVADDPGMHSSQNEQDSRHFARMSRLPMLEPADPQEAYDFAIEGLCLSREYDCPVLLRMTTRTSHTRGVVACHRPESLPVIPSDLAAPKYVMVPGNARRRRPLVEERLRRLREWAEISGLNRWEKGSSIGIVAAGIAYAHARQVFPDASFLKLGLVYPLPEELIRRFAESVSELWIVEEGDEIFADSLRYLPVPAKSLRPDGNWGELALDHLLAVKGEVPEDIPALPVPPRAPVMCSGCPHRSAFYAFHRMETVVFGDIGCYTLGALPPLNSMSTCVCMGSGISLAAGYKRIHPEEPVVAVLGDSTFAHAGLPAIVELVYNRHPVVVVVVDNRSTAMTGGQENPSSGSTLKGDPAPVLDIEQVCRAMGVSWAATVDSSDYEAVRSALESALAENVPAVLVVKGDCRVAHPVPRSDPLYIEETLCTECGFCIELGCPGLKGVDGRPVISPDFCVGCGLCVQICATGAIS